MAPAEQGVFKASCVLARDNKALRGFRNPLTGFHSAHTGEEFFFFFLAVELHTHAHTQLTSKQNWN